MYCTAQEIQPIFYNNDKWNITFKSWVKKIVNHLLYSHNLYDIVHQPYPHPPKKKLVWWKNSSCHIHRSCPNFQKWSVTRTSPVVQWLRLGASMAGGTGSVPGRGTKIPQTMKHSQKKEENKKKRFVTEFRFILTSRKFSDSISSNQITAWFALIDCVFVWVCVCVCAPTFLKLVLCLFRPLTGEMDETDTLFPKLKQVAEDSLFLTFSSTEPIFIDGTVDPILSRVSLGGIETHMQASRGWGRGVAPEPASRQPPSSNLLSFPQTPTLPRWRVRSKRTPVSSRLSPGASLWTPSMWRNRRGRWWKGRMCSMVRRPAPLLCLLF